VTSPLNILFYVDSGAGQSMCSCPDAFLSLQPCAIEVVGVAGSLPIFGVGTAMFVVTTTPALPVTILVHNCLLSQGSPFNLLSVSHYQASGRHTVDFSVGGPTLRIRSGKGDTTMTLVPCEGLYGFHAEPLHPNDDRYRSLPRYHLTARSMAGATPAPPLRAASVATADRTVHFGPRGFTGIVSSWLRESDSENQSSAVTPGFNELDTGVLPSAATTLGH
jgi:hypothetical protein